MPDDIIPLATPEVISRDEAVAIGLMRYFTGKACKRGHVAERKVSSRNCLECHREASIAWVRANPEEALRRGYLWRDNNRDKYNAKAYRWREANIEAARAATAKQKAANPEKYRAYEGTRRARKVNSGGEFSQQDIFELLNAQRHRCACCSASLNGKYEVDHIIPLALGGTNIRKNLQVLCKPCNRRKGAKDPIEFMQSLGRLL